MIDNIEILEFCFINKEPYIDEFYIKDNNIIISNNPITVNKLMQANIDLLDNISAYKIALESNNEEMQLGVLKNILNILKVTGINFSEFISYWSVNDMSYSLYNKIFKTDKIKLTFLADITKRYIDNRHSLYQKHGYSLSTLQVLKDSRSHKSSGNLGIKKVDTLFNNLSFNYFNNEDIDDFVNASNIYIHPDKKDKELFKKILIKYKIKFNWSLKYQGKYPDYLFKVDDKIFILEHKHIKEYGGGQDKQISEIINFISQEESQNNIYYVSFLDGVYFNLLAESNTGKPNVQKQDIQNNLNKFKNNYFVNVKGFIKLINNINVRNS